MTELIAASVDAVEGLLLSHQPLLLTSLDCSRDDVLMKFAEVQVRDGAVAFSIYLYLFNGILIDCDASGYASFGEVKSTKFHPGVNPRSNMAAYNIEIAVETGVFRFACDDVVARKQTWSIY